MAQRASQTQQQLLEQQQMLQALNSRQIEQDRAKCTYTKCYCEENVWQLCSKLMTSDADGLKPTMKVLEPYYAVFISNPAKQVLLFKQSAGHPPDGRCIWDYHVILVGKLLGPGKKSLVYDLDTTLNFPCPIDTYFNEALMSDDKIPDHYRRNFRVIPAGQYFTEFASDRRHMRRRDGSWISPPPTYDPIRGSNSLVDFNLHQFIDMNEQQEGSNAKQLGMVLTDSYQFLTFFSRGC